MNRPCCYGNMNDFLVNGRESGLRKQSAKVDTQWCTEEAPRSERCENRDPKQRGRGRLVLRYRPGNFSLCDGPVLVDEDAEGWQSMALRTCWGSQEQVQMFSLESLKGWPHNIP